MALDTRELFARLIQCEAGGEGEQGMAAVATVVMNRATATEGQFSRIGNGGDVRGCYNPAGSVRLYARIGCRFLQSAKRIQYDSFGYTLRDRRLGYGRRTSGRNRQFPFLFQPVQRRMSPEFSSRGWESFITV